MCKQKQIVDNTCNISQGVGVKKALNSEYDLVS